jgi:hypothetical protein
VSRLETFGVAGRWIGRTIGALSLFNLAHGLFAFGLSDLIARVLQAYAQLLSVLGPIVALVHWLASLADIHLPERLHDAVMLYGVFGLANLRTSHMWASVKFLWKEAAGPVHRAAMIANLAFSILLWPLNLALRPLVWLWDYFEIRIILRGVASFIDVVAHGFGVWVSNLRQFTFETILILAALAALLMANVGALYAEALWRGAL